jgi:hypothetical protein
MDMKNKNEINVYWWPGVMGWDIFYNEPTNLLTSLIEKKNANSGKRSMFQCPAFSNKMKKTYVFTFPMDVEYRYDFSDPENPLIFPVDENKPYLNVSINRPPTISKMPLFQISLYFSIFSEEDLVASFTPPYFHKPQYMVSASSAPGSFDIGKWLRPFPLEMILWDEVGIIKFKKDEPLFYVEFLTDRPINLQRVRSTENLISYGNQGGNASLFLESRVPLLKRYETFRNTGMKKLIMKEITENII